MERDAGEGGAGDGRGDSVIARDLEGIFQLAAKSAPVFPAPFIKSIIFSWNLQKKTLNTDAKAKLPADNESLYH